MNDQDISSDKLSLKVNALLIIDIQEKIKRPIFDKDSISLKPLTFAATLPASKTSSFSNSSVLPHLIQIK